MREKIEEDDDAEETDCKTMELLTMKIPLKNWEEEYVAEEERSNLYRTETLEMRIDEDEDTES